MQASGAHKIKAALTACLLLGSLLIVLLKLSAGAAFDSNILSLFPSEYDSPMNAQAGRILQHMSERRINILASSDQGALAETFLQALDNQLLRAGLVNRKRVTVGVDDFRDWYRPYRYQLLTAEQRNYFRSATIADIAQAILHDLYSPFSSARVYPIAEDPFGISGAWFKQLQGNPTQGKKRIRSVLYQGRTWFVLDVSLQQSPFNLGTQSGVAAALELAYSASKQQQIDGDLHVLTSGMLFHAAAGATLARSEVKSLGLLSLLAITTLVLLAFRSLRVLVSIATVLAGSVTVALAACLLLFEKVNLITLAFGTSLLGIAVDYAFHYFCLYRAGANRFVVANRIRGGVLLSVASTIIAYTLQFASPFPGLHQFAVFIIAGIIAAGLMVVFLIPHFLSDTAVIDFHGGRAHRLFSNILLPMATKMAEYRRTLMVGLVLAAVLSVVSLHQHGSNDDIKSLNTSSAKLMEMEKSVSAILSRSGGQQFFTVQGDLELRLQQAEIVNKNLADMRADNAAEQNVSQSLLSIAQFIPSQARQRADYDLLMARLFAEGGVSSALCSLDAALCPLVKEQPKFDPSLVPGKVPAAISIEFDPDLLRQADFDLLIPVQQLTTSELKHALSGTDQVQGVDRAVELSGQLGVLRVQITWLVVSFLCSLALLALYVFGRRGWVVMLPLLLSILLALSFASVDGVTLFHLLAVLLVIGLTIDAAIFYLTLGFNHDVWLAASLSSLTSMCAFGLLSYSAVPVLAQFGAVISIGLLSAWCLIPLVYCMVNTKAR